MPANSTWTQVARPLPEEDPVMTNLGQGKQFLLQRATEEKCEAQILPCSPPLPKAVKSNLISHKHRPQNRPTKMYTPNLHSLTVNFFTIRLDFSHFRISLKSYFGNLTQIICNDITRHPANSGVISALQIREQTL